ncbi:MAG TPA: B3/4 domain-containing protein [Candidatus Nitrosotalea sp.]|nr:B3/4 domain-containing protein [Candidatus Nitrosotalea sp.]
MLVVRFQVEPAPTVLELHELEVTLPRSDFDAEVAAAELWGRNRARAAGLAPPRVRRVNSVLDVAAAVSLASGIPIGVLDLDKVVGAIEVRLGRKGESYAAGAGRKLAVAGEVVVADGVAVCSSAKGDGLRTAVHLDTTRAAWVFYHEPAPSLLSRTAELLALHGRGLMRLAEVAT